MEEKAKKIVDELFKTVNFESEEAKSDLVTSIERIVEYVKDPEKI